jgi:hypothetical protein
VWHGVLWPILMDKLTPLAVFFVRKHCRSSAAGFVSTPAISVSAGVLELLGSGGARMVMGQATGKPGLSSALRECRGVVSMPASKTLCCFYVLACEKMQRRLVGLAVPAAS